MKSSRAIVMFLVLTLAMSLPTGAFAADLASPAGARLLQLDHDLLKEVLRASGILDADEMARYERSFETMAAQLAGKVGGRQSTYRLARKLHDALHQKVLLHYAAAADGMDAVLDRGEFNCLSASLLYGILGRAIGLDVKVAEIPRHVYVQVWVDGRRVIVETTSPKGFDLRPPLDTVASSSGMGYGSNAAAAPPALGYELGAEAVDLERAVGFLWHNAGRRALERGDTLLAARSFLEESKLRPLEEGRSETLAALLARAFRMEYEVGNFEIAYRVAEIGMRIFPGQTTARDRLLAAALKRIEAASEGDAVENAEAMLNETAFAAGDLLDVRRLRRGACPVIMAAAVRLGDWDRAERMVRQFQDSEPDKAESRRLAKWVARRRLETSYGDERNACSEHGSILTEESGEVFLGGPAAGRIPRSGSD
ncbi:MAG TPA: hypothetical protein VFW45_12480 [Candidatus Polarisedimenticolia bacterium]|nr:hypothetical protein [Candidatus Polarisedimenticolia bacterium]